MNSRDDIEREVLANRARFEILVEKAVSALELYRRVELAKDAVDFASSHSTGYFASSELERVFLDLASSFEVGPRDEPVPDSVLHVMTKCYAVGGHTRVVERWIELSPEKHSLVFTEDEAQNVPPRLQQAISNCSGVIEKLPDSLDLVQKAKRLRQLASRFQRVVLHVHMHDVLPLVAFGAPEFQRPVIFFNHADHRFWVGVSIADVIAETRLWGCETSLRKRDTQRSVNLGIPVDGLTSETCAAGDVRGRLGLRPEHKVILTAGGPHKYRKIPGFDFLSAVLPILDENPEAVLVGIGPTSNNPPEWGDAERRYPKRVFALGFKSPAELYEWARVSALAIDSFPMSGGTALSDMTSAGCPVLALRCPTDHLDYIKETEAYCEDVPDMMRRANAILKDPSMAEANVVEVSRHLLEHNGAEQWMSKLRSVYARAGDLHRIHEFKTVRPDDVSDLDAYLWVESFNRKRLLKWRKLELFSYRDRGHLRFEIVKT